MNSGPAYDFDVAIIGGGSGGYAAARTAADAGLRTAVIEGGNEIGGLCILRGCMPTKALLYAAEVMHLAAHSDTWGIRANDASFDFARVMARKNELIKVFADYRTQQLQNGRFEFIRANAHFADAHTVELDTGRKLTAESFVIATGSKIAPSPLPSLDAVGYLNSDTALELTRLPISIIVLGGGAVALEFAQIFARFGVMVTLIQRGPHVLHDMDPDAAEVIENVFRRGGTTIQTGTKLLEAKRLSDGQKEVVFEQEGQIRRVAAAEIFYALGRVSNTDGLGLDQAGVGLEGRRIITNSRMQTTVPHIYAAGDCTGLHDIVHIAVQQGEIAAANIVHPDQPKEMDYRLLIEVVFTDPQIAVVGLTEKEARARNIPCRVAKYPFNDHGKSQIMACEEGFVKLLGDPATGEIIGGCCVGPVGGELIHEIIVAMAKRMTASELAAVPHYHPTLAEIWTYPAEELAAECKKGVSP